MKPSQQGFGEGSANDGLVLRKARQLIVRRIGGDARATLEKFPSPELRYRALDVQWRFLPAFLSVAVILATSSPEHILWRPSAVSRLHRKSNEPAERRRSVAAVLPILYLGNHRNDSQDSDGRELLALSRLRRDLDACSTADSDVRTVAPVINPTAAVPTDRARIVRELHELIAALDRRVPQVHRLGELAIARAAAALRGEALKRIEELEGEVAVGVRSVETD